MHDWIVPSGINLLDFEAFVYRVWNVRTGRSYIGFKSVYCKRKGKRLVSNYLKYWGSSDELTDDIKHLGLDDFRREILHVCKTRHQAIYLEAKEMFARDVLTATLPNGERAFWNSNILRSFFAPRGQYHARKRAYDLKPLQCRCGATVKFAKRHTEHCSARCLQLSAKEHETPKKRAPAKRAKASAGKVRGGASNTSDSSSI